VADAVERLYKLTVDGTQAVRELEKISKSTASIDAGFAAAGRAVKAFGVALVAAVAAEGLRGLAEGVLSTAEAFDQLGKDAAKVGVAVEDLQRLRYAADLSGVSAEQMDKAIGALAVGMQHLGNATDDTSKLLKAIGVTSGDSPAAALGKIADHFASMPNGVAKLSEAIAIFGKKIGPELIPLLNDGAAGLKKMTDQAAEFGGVVGGNATAAAEKFNDNMARMQRQVSGMGRSLVVGMLPALQAIAQTMTQASTSGDGFRKTGVLLGEGLVKLATGAIYTSQAIRTLGASLEFLARIRLEPTSGWQAGKELVAQIKEIDRQTESAARRLRINFRAAKAEMEAPAAPGKKDELDAEGLLAKMEAQQKAAEAAAKAAAKAATELHDAWEPVRKLEADIRDETVDHAAAQRLLNDAMAKATDLAGKLTDANIDQANANRRVEDAINAQIKAQEDADRDLQGMIKLAQEGTEAQRRLAGAWLEHELALKHMAPVVDEWKDVQDKLGAGFDRFVDSLASGSVTAAQAFRGMVQSITADLLKLAAQKFILEAFGIDISPTKKAQGGAFIAGMEVAPFALGGVVSSPTRFRMAGARMGLMGEAGPEAIMPLARTGDGALGVRATMPALQVAIHNYTDAQVSARRDDAGNLQVVIEQTKRAVAADIRRGGTDIARAAESAWRLSRGAAAPF
jgi:phage-related minor tail protein